jgi:phosphate-selective porin OprO and OprP
MKKQIFSIMLLIFIGMSSALMAQDSLPSAAPRVEAMGPKAPGVSFKRGIEIMQPDSLYSLNLRFRVQNRAMYSTLSQSDFSMSEAEARVRRLRLRLEGFMYDPKLTYLVQLSFSRGDMDWDVRHNSILNNSPNVVRDAAMYYRPTSNWTFIFGQTKLPGNRQRVVSSGDLQFIDRSIVNAAFNVDRDFGFQAYYQNKFGNSFTYMLKTALTSGEGRNVVSTDRGLAYTGRVEVMPLGEFKNRGDYFEGDLEREESVKVSLAGGLSYNELARRTGGQIGRDLFQSRDMTTYIFDGLVKYRGFALYAEYMERMADNPVTTNEEGQTRSIYRGNGAMVQASYLLPSNYEIAGRYAYVTPEGQSVLLENREDVITAGVTKYLIKHRLKLQGNISYHTLTAPASNPRSNWVAGFQMELGI